MPRPRRIRRAVSAVPLVGALLFSGLAGTTAQAASVSTWDKVAECESGGDWQIVSSGAPTYYGGLQFSKSTWDAFGGRQYAAYAHQATKMQQILIAEKVLAVQGQGAWPHCGPAAGLGADHTDPYPAPAPSDSGDFHHAVRAVAGHWTSFAPLDGYQGAARFAGSRQAITATPDGSLQVAGVGTDGNLYHNARFTSGSWAGWAPVDGYDGAARFAASQVTIAGMPNGDAQLVAVGSDGKLYHTARFAGGSWQGWSPVTDWGARKVAAAGLPNGDLQLAIVGNDGKLYHNIRYANGSWQGWRGVAGFGGAADFTASSVAVAGMPDGATQMIAVGNDGGLYHTTRQAGGSWQEWGRVSGISSPSDIALAGMPNGDAQLLAVANDTSVYHNARFAGGSWQGWNSVGVHARKVGIAGLGSGDAHVLTTAG
ncbi:transglycosylase family protein [Streptomyces sp. ISL-99]|uniref:transglycosylase family protein n=1 Tax=Streptomyces sp. ISL-99 TaxID=2819193 RepID=UPI001BEBD108|nr:transglycosylase family protein [Streptomyces sp. ISL-99]MBT2528510.1 transglycosylase family protein [Streptomyces sp. ISL-99]